MHGFKFPRQRINYWRKVPHSGRTAIEHLTPQLFLLCMGTGVLSVLLHNNPYQFNGLGTSIPLTRPLSLIAVCYW